MASSRQSAGVSTGTAFLLFTENGSSVTGERPAGGCARATSDTFAGIRPLDVPGFVLAQVAGAILALAFGRWLLREPKP
jgi:hypothetical protein